MHKVVYVRFIGLDWDSKEGSMVKEISTFLYISTIIEFNFYKRLLFFTVSIYWILEFNRDIVNELFRTSLIF